ncbi:hypothetical protein FQN54_004172 [Arachnomyces sp. PD_36]|nr:hypothetical protein FQN54_004172 [Arachnomyces sp. PD_36]
MEDNADFYEFSDPDSAKIWRTILRPGAAEDEQFINKYYKWRRPLSIKGLLGSPRIWMSWAYKAAYPRLAAFLEKASLDSKFRAQVILEDIKIHEGFFRRRKLLYNEAHAALSMVFDALKTFPTELEAANTVAEWIKDTDWSSFMYEYHFSFYYVTLDALDPSTVKPDPRKVRRSSPFGQARNMKHRYIHEETVSFLLCGHFDDAFTCIQLGDAYFRPRYAKNTGPRAFRSYDPNQSPGQFFLYWIAVALFHARSRWENAINSLDSEIKSPADVVFMEDRSDLMADDPQFSLSKTYFWALQTYKLFERGLRDTITTWENFKKESLPKVRDGRISPEDWNAAVESIDQAIDKLRLKIARVQRGIQDVKDLREGLQSTAAVFDSRTAVRQGENIRLLTYITLLFLPLSFGTGIFSMQIIDMTPNTIKAFAITLPIITVISALIIFNLDTAISSFDTLVRRFTFGLQRRMKAHYRKDWKDRAVALHEDHLIKEPPARKAAKQSSHWVYVLFLIEAAIVVLPVSEVDAALNFYGLLRSREESIQDDDSSEQPEAEAEPKRMRKKEVRRRVKQAAQQAKEEERRRRDEEKGALKAFIDRLSKQSFRTARLFALLIFSFFRALLLPVWILLLTLQYVLITGFLALMDIHLSREESSPKARSTQEKIPPFKQAWRVLGLDTISFLRRRRNRGKPSGSSDESTPERFPSTSRVSLKESKPTTTAPAEHSGSDHLEVHPMSGGAAGANYEISTFAEQAGQTVTMRRITRAVNYASHGRGYIPGDYERAEMPRPPALPDEGDGGEV